MASDFNMDDPWNWSVDRVVQELCTSSRTWQPQSPAMPLISNPESLEAVLRDQEVTGSVLLKEINMSVLKDDFGIKALGRRSFIMSAIDQLRSKSLIYSSYMNEPAPNILNSELGRGLQEVLCQIQQKNFSKPSSLISQPIQHIQHNDQISELSPRADGQPSEITIIPELEENEDIEINLTSSLRDDSNAQKRVKLNSPSISQQKATVLEETCGEKNSIVQNTSITLSTSSSPCDFPIEEVSEKCGMKRKRIAPTWVSPISSTVVSLQETSIQTPQFEVEHNVTDMAALIRQDSSPEPFSKPGVVFKDSDGRRRIIPFLQAGSSLSKTVDEQSMLVKDESETNKVASLGQTLNNSESYAIKLSNSGIFLGKKKMNVDSIFYDGTPVGSEIKDLDDPTNFYSGYKTITKGRRLYVHGRLRYFLRSQQQEIISEGKKCFIKIPYPRSLVPKFKDQSFSLYHLTTHGKVVVRREVKFEASTHNIQSLGSERLAFFNPSNQNFLDQIGTGTEFDYDSLEKYKFLEGGNEVLPLYGDSDEDNEFDEATWKEIEAEYGEHERPKQSLRKPLLSKIEVEQAIDAGIAEIVNSWNTKNIAKRERKAWRLWHQSRRSKTKHEQIAAAKIDLNHANQYLEKVKEKIIAEIWTSKLQVRKQLGSMEASITSREELKWKINVLKQRTQPYKPPPASPKSKAKKAVTKKVTVTDDIEGESISNSELETSDDDVDDFDDFIDDDETITTGSHLHELNFADSENDDVILSDSSVPDESIFSPKTLSQNKRNPPESSQGILGKNSPLDETHSRTLEGLKVSSEIVYMSPMNSAKNNISKLKYSKPETSNLHNSNKSEIIDLTSGAISDDNEHIKAHDSSTPPNSTKIPFIDITLSSEDESSSKCKSQSIKCLNSSKKHEKSGIESNNSPIPNHPRRFSGLNQRRSSEKSDDGIPTSDKIPPLRNPEAIAKYSYDVWQKLNDKERLLTKFFFQLNLTLRLEILREFSNSSPEQLWIEIRRIIRAKQLKDIDISQSEDTRTKILVRIIGIFEMYVDCRFYSFKSKLEEKQLKKFRMTRLKDFNLFYDTCLRISQFIKLHCRASQVAKFRSSKSAISNTKEDQNDQFPLPTDRQFRLKGTSIFDGESSPNETRRLKRKKSVHENKEARDMREQDLRRLAQQNERRKKLHAALVEANDDQAIVLSQLIINDAAAEDQKYIYVNNHIAKRIKKHQVEGVRFLWNQIVAIADEKSMQGCLLAHTMGLGKTMQTITLLVAIAEASRSNDPSVSSQIPESLRISKTLILCPPSLVNNWMDELLVWVPDSMLGELRKVDSSIKFLPQRLQTIIDWNEDGGVLVIGYEMFRDLVNYKSKNISDAEHELVSKILLESPNIIIADEAHRMKNRKAAITIAASKFRSKSRIALTGSPLANNVEEYHTMIEWVAPNYLGPIVEFRAKYVAPIQAGNYQNSTAYERRKSLKMLGVLSADLAPKVHRADMSVMKNDLPPKKEFVITVPLTEVQKQAYTIFVRSMMAGNNYTTTKLGEVTSTTVWHWLAVLSLLCNHPECFRQKLLKRKEEARIEASKPVELEETDNEETAVDLNAPVWKVGVSQELIDAECKMFAAKKSLDSIQMSNKVLHLCQILDACKSIGDKALVFSQSIPTLDFLEEIFKRKNRNYARLDGSTAMSKRQVQTKDFNNGDTDIYLISTTAGGLGLNLQGANRVIIFDFKFNPIMEEQAVGRAYRIGQKKPTFIYRFIAGGTFEDSVHNRTVFKTQLASRVVDKKNPVAWANKKASEFLFEPKEVPQKDLSEFEGMDPCVLDRLLQNQKRKDQRGIPRTICSIVQTDTFAVDDDDKLTPDEEKEVQSELEKTRLFRANPHAFLLQQAAEQQYLRQQFLQQNSMPSMGNSPHNDFNAEQNSLIKRNDLTLSSGLLESTILSSVEDQSSYPNLSLDESFPKTTYKDDPISQNKTNISRPIATKARSPVAGANTKVATLESGNFNMALTKKIETRDSQKVLVLEKSKNSNLPASNNSEIIPLDDEDKEIQKNCFQETLSKNDDEQPKPEELELKSPKKPTEEWDISKRYRESRGSNLPDYGPIAPPTLSNTTSGNYIPKAPFHDIVNKQQLKITPHSSSNQGPYPNLNKNRTIPHPYPKKDGENAERLHEKRQILRNDVLDPPLNNEPKIQQSTTNRSPGRVISNPYRKSSVFPAPNRPASPPSYRRSSQPSYRRTSPLPYRRSPPSSFIPTGPRISGPRHGSSWHGNDDWSRTYQTYRPSDRHSPYHDYHRQ
ncbi:putative snf2 family helicase snf2 family helicase atpase [Erysiphe neolycopersici]|uniref:Putative snf2 family helicase snf2 family helicase atpase n=1 Tax=Erysiphe neolycopersici TaxID=212602 RepID=A0A420I2U4_9PEZI|nr:putative snf2 family helicase snf2 family helicase atpase [Erysiphe neolycopersici]